jgi:hypothetical protein
VISSITLLPCIFYNTGVNRYFNKYSVQVMCEIREIYTIETTCTYDCNCKTESDTWNTYKQVCATCYKQCEDGHFTLLPLVNSKDPYSIIKDVDYGIIDDTFYAYNLPGNNIPCYYESYTGQILLDSTDDPVYKTFNTISIVLPFIYLCVWIFIECIRDPK